MKKKRLHPNSELKKKRKKEKTNLTSYPILPSYTIY